MNRTLTNIERIQEQVKVRINDLLMEHGYSLDNEEYFGESQALLLQWKNEIRNHTFQLIWDIREQWFELGEFNRTKNLNSIEGTEIELFPFSVIGVLFRDRYNNKYIEKIELRIKEKLDSKTEHNTRYI